MGKYILETAGEIDWMAIGPLIIFFVFFIGVLIYAARLNKEKIDRFKHLPLEEE